MGALMLEIGSTVSHFQILGKIGAGGMGEVFLAEDSRLHRKVALKRLSESSTQSPGARKRLLQEARAAAQLSHPNIAAIHDIIESGDQAYIVMEYVQGENLAARLERGLPSVEESLAIGMQVAEALACAHAQGIIHRDLKPANLILTPENKVKVLDFGLAKMPPASEPAHGGESNAETSLTSPGMIVGTLAYMSPQQVLGKPPDTRNDIYSLGVVLFELLTGRKPFAGTNGMGLAMEILTHRTPVPSEFNSDLPAGVSGVVSRAMASEEDQRYPSAEEFRADLEQLLASVRAGGNGEQLFSRISSVVRRGVAGPGRWWVFGLFLLVAVLSYVTFTRLHMRGKEPPVPAGDTHPVIAVLPFSNLSGNAADESLCDSVTYVLSSNLAAAGGVTMVPYASASKYRDPQRDLKKIARELGATLLVDGGIQHTRDAVVASVNLIQAASNTVAWGKSYSVGAEEVLAIHRQLAEGLVDALQLNPTAAERDRILSLPTGNRDAFADYSQARNFLDREDVPGNVDRAIQLFQSAIARDMQFALAHAGLGQSYLLKYNRTNDAAFVTSARKSLDEALRLDPDRAEVRIVLAGMLGQTGRYSEALAELDKVVSMHPRNDEARSLRGRICQSQGKQDDAIREYQAAIGIRPEYWGHYAGLGYVYYRVGRVKEAIPQFRRVTELQPDNAWGFQMLGTAYHKLGDLQTALAYYQQTLRISPNAKAYSNIGTLEYERRNYAEAVRAYEQATKLDPHDHIALRNCGDAYVQLGDRRKASASYSAAASIAAEMLKVNPKSASTLAFLALYEAKLGLGAEAARHASEAFRLAPKDNEVIYKKAVVHALAGQRNEALDVLKQALELGYSARLAHADDDLAAIRTLPQFEKLLSGQR